MREAVAIAYTPNFSDAFASVTAEAFRSQLLEVTRAADTFSIVATIATAGRPLFVERAVAAESRGCDQATQAAQSVKHSVGGKELEAVMSLVPTVEGLLFFALRR